MLDDVSCQFYLWSPYITSVFSFPSRFFIYFEGLRYVPRKEKNTSSTRDSYCVFGGEFYCQKIIDLLNAICLFIKLIMNGHIMYRYRNQTGF
jgi:hypothetical protein